MRWRRDTAGEEGGAPGYRTRRRTRRSDELALLRPACGGELLSPALLARLGTVVVDDEGYASGGRVRTLNLGRGAETVAWHTGSNGPSTSRVSRATASGLTVITLSNTGADSDDTGALAEDLLGAMATD